MAEQTGKKEMTSEEARHAEELFINGCREKLRNARGIADPLQGREIHVAFADDYYELHSNRKAIKKIMQENEIYDKHLLEEAPLGRWFRYTVYEQGWFRKKPVIRVSGRVLCEFADFLKSGKSTAPTPASEVEMLRLEAQRKSRIFHYIGVYGLCGFDEDTYALPLSGPNWEIALVEHKGGTAYRITGGEKTRRESVLAFFDPENESEKLWRAKSVISASGDLSVAGGFLILSDLAEELGISQDLVQKVADEVCASDNLLSLERVEGKLIMKRSRL